MRLRDLQQILGKFTNNEMDRDWETIKAVLMRLVK